MQIDSAAACWTSLACICMPCATTLGYRCACALCVTPYGFGFRRCYCFVTRVRVRLLENNACEHTHMMLLVPVQYVTSDRMFRLDNR